MYHISPKNNLIELRPFKTRSPNSWGRETREKCISGAKEWYFALCMMPHFRLKGRLYLYYCKDEKFKQQGGGFNESKYEWRAYEPIPCELIGELNLEHMLVKHIRETSCDFIAFWQKKKDPLKLVLKP